MAPRILSAGLGPALASAKEKQEHDGLIDHGGRLWRSNLAGSSVRFKLSLGDDL